MTYDGTYTTTISGVAATFKLVYGSSDLIADAEDAYGDFAGKGTVVASGNLYLGDDKNSAPASETVAAGDNNIVRFEDTSDFSRSIQARTATVAAKEDAVVKAVQDAAQKAFTDAYKDENVTWKAEIADKKLYLLDEPSVGLHWYDLDKLAKILQALADQGNTILMIEHNLDLIKIADHIIDLGPEGGNDGGSIVAQGTPQEIMKCKNSYTGKYLKKYLNKQ